MLNDERKKNDRKYESKRAINFFEELCWLLDSNKDINIKQALNDMKNYRNILAHGDFKNIVSDEYSLIGVLPSLLKDSEIFQSNAQLVQFAEEVLDLNIPRWEKKSKNEIIGLIICEVEEANKKRVDVLVKWTRNIVNNKNVVKNMQKVAKSTGNIFSWNETIQKLLGAEK